MGEKILTKTDREMEDRMLAVQNDPMRAETLQKARQFKRTWLELAQALARVQAGGAWEAWGFSDFDAYCRKELHLRANTVAKLLGSYRFLETSAPNVIARAHEDPFEAPIPSVKAVEFVQRATDRGAADAETLETMKRVAFDEGVEAPLLARRFKDVAFPESDREKAEKLRASIAGTARRLSSLIAEEGSPVSKKIAVQVEEAVGLLLESIEN